MIQNNNPLLFSLESMRHEVSQLPVLRNELANHQKYSRVSTRTHKEKTLEHKILMLEGIERALKLVPKSKLSRKIFAPAVEYKFKEKPEEWAVERIGGLPDMSEFIGWLAEHALLSKKPFDLDQCIDRNWPVDGYDGAKLPFITQMLIGTWQMAWHSLIAKGYDGMIYSPLRWAGTHDEYESSTHKFVWAETTFKNVHPCYDARVLSWNPPGEGLMQKWVIPQKEIRAAIAKFAKAKDITLLPAKELVKPTFTLVCEDYDLADKLEKKDPLFKRDGDITVFGVGASQQQVLTPYSTSYSGLRMAPFITWTDFDYDLTHQVYMEAEPHSGFWTYGKMSSSCT